MKKLFLILLALIGIPVAAFVLWVVAEVTVLTMADGDYSDGDYTAAMEKWRLASTFSFSGQAETAIGKLYLYGEGVEKDEEEATKWFIRAADNYDWEGTYYLGMQYKLGVGAPLDYEKAAHYLGMAAIGGYGAAQFYLGTMSLYGQGIAEDPRRGMKLVTKAVANGDHQVRYGLRAFFLLGVWRADSESDLHDPVEAYKWLLLAATGGDKEADDLLTKFDKVLTKDATTEANTRAVTWMKENIEVD
jgi:TPR repeat protein